MYIALWLHCHPAQDLSCPQPVGDASEGTLHSGSTNGYGWACVMRCMVMPGLYLLHSALHVERKLRVKMPSSSMRLQYACCCVCCSALHVKVGDFNLSRYMSLGVSYVKSSLEINPVRAVKAPQILCTIVHIVSQFEHCCTHCLPAVLRNAQCEKCSV
jgi:hypothetical protein